MAHCLFSAKPLSEPNITYCQLDHPEKYISMKYYLKFNVIQGNTFENIVC